MSLPLTQAQQAACEAAMQVAIAKIEANGRAYRAHVAMIDNDPRIIARRAALKALSLAETAGGVFAEMADGCMQRRAVLSRLIRARIELLSGFPHIARKHIADAAVCRRQSFAIVSASPELVVMEQRFSPVVPGVSSLKRVAA